MKNICFKNIKNVYNGTYVKMYEATYINLEGKEKVYEMASRYNINSENDFTPRKPSGVSLIIFNQECNKILLLKEFRMSTNDIVVNFVSGLIDKNETPTETAIRELKEETGLEISKFIGILPESYSSIGITNEKVVTMICIAKGNFEQSTSPNELINASWYSKQELIEILKNYTCSTNVCLLSYLWINGFLNIDIK